MNQIGRQISGDATKDRSEDGEDAARGKHMREAREQLTWAVKDARNEEIDCVYNTEQPERDECETDNTETHWWIR